MYFVSVAYVVSANVQNRLLIFLNRTYTYLIITL